MSNVECRSPEGGSYLLYLRVREPLELRVGALGQWRFLPGRYAYVGSARAGIAGRVERHLKVAQGEGRANPHWHVDYLLLDPAVIVESVERYPGQDECELSQQLFTAGGEVPVPGFGASDCRRGCRAHLYRMSDLQDA